MGWLWSSTTPEKSPNEDSTSTTKSPGRSAPFSSPSDPPPPRDSSFTTSDSNNPTDPSTLAADSTTNDDQTRPRTRDEIANAEILSFFRQLEEERKSAAKEAPLAPDGDDDEDDDDEEDDEPPALLTPARLYNSEMSCLDLLDAAWFCASPGGQFFNLYRYGTLRQCGQLWYDMSYCWRINRTTFNSELRAQRTLQRHWKRERDRLREKGGCSEEVWGEGRRWVETNAFKADWDGENSPFRKGSGD